MRHAPRLSETEAGRAWVQQFKGSPDMKAAAEMLDAMMLLDGEQVSEAQRFGIDQLKTHLPLGRPSKKKFIALYAEREFSERAIFQSEWTVDKKGKLHFRAVKPKSVKAVAPRRGSSRVGSEGSGAFVISQMVEKRPGRFLNHPGPQAIRRRGVAMIGIVTDFIGSGTRICTMLDKFWQVPSIRAWWSLGWIQFGVVAAAGTKAGLERVTSHKTRPNVFTQYLAPTVDTAEPAQAARWNELVNNYGPAGGRGSSALGFGETKALVAFSYRLPNNTPAIIHKSGGGWRALYAGPIQQESKQAFLPLSEEERIANSLESAGMTIDPTVKSAEARIVLILTAIRGRLRKGAVVELAERTGLTIKDVKDAVALANKQGFLSSKKRLTDKGHAFVEASLRSKTRQKIIPSNKEPYYPWSLRVPKVAPSASRPSGRPK